MYPGKRKCRELRNIRIQIAKDNNIDYVPTKYNHKGDCKGFCNKCDEELKYLTDELEKIENPIIDAKKFKMLSDAKKIYKHNNFKRTVFKETGLVKSNDFKIEDIKIIPKEIIDNTMKELTEIDIDYKFLNEDEDE